MSGTLLVIGIFVVLLLYTVQFYCTYQWKLSNLAVLLKSTTCLDWWLLKRPTLSS